MILTSKVNNKQHFSGSAADTVKFSYPVRSLLLTTSGTVGLSLDGGTNFMTMTAGTYQFTIFTLQLDFNGSGTWSGIGIV